MKIEDASGKSRDLKSENKELDFKARLKRSMKSAGLFLLLAVFSIPVPGLHFFLVPSFLVLALYLSVKRFSERYSVDLTEEICPVCEKSLHEGVVHFKQDHLRLYCSECRSQLRILS
ncbi:MAG: hypothetical protein ACXVCN_07855 [Bdellovibrio sp.]